MPHALAGQEINHTYRLPWPSPHLNPYLPQNREDASYTNRSKERCRMCQGQCTMIHFHLGALASMSPIKWSTEDLWETVPPFLLCPALVLSVKYDVAHHIFILVLLVLLIVACCLLSEWLSFVCWKVNPLITCRIDGNGKISCGTILLVGLVCWFLLLLVTHWYNWSS